MQVEKNVGRKPNGLDLSIVFNIASGIHRGIDPAKVIFNEIDQRLNRKGLSDKRLAVGFCLGSGLFGSYNSD